LLCVIVIIAIVAAVFAGVIAKAIIHVKKFLAATRRRCLP
jgi:hypothetical protein